MSKILVVIGSARKGRVAEKVLGYIQTDIEAREGVEMEVADLKEINLPYFDNELPPVSPDFDAANTVAKSWSETVKAADSVLFITPEYNHTLSAIQKNALDWLGTEWLEKPVSAVAYGWSGGSLAVLTLREVLENLKADTEHEMAQLTFMKELNPDGSLLDADSTALLIKTAVDELIK
jgi:NAD(P)H-dependent FMN reductase